MSDTGYPPTGGYDYQAAGWTAPPSPTLQPPRRPRDLHGRRIAVAVVIGVLLFALTVTLAVAGIVHLLDSSPSFVVTRAPASAGSSAGGSSSEMPAGPLSVDDAAAAVTPGIVDIYTTYDVQGGQGAGTGMVLSSSGVVLTNNHVIKGATEISVTALGNGQTYSADVLGYDRSHDVAVLQLRDAEDLPTVPLGDSSTLSPGDEVTALGNAGGEGGAPHVAPGQVTALEQTITAGDMDGSDVEQLEGLIQTNAPIQPGDSGGPLVDDSGQVVGIDTAASASQSSTGLSTASEGYAIPIDDALAIVEQIAEGTASETVHIGGTALLGVEVVSSAQGGGYGYGYPDGSQAGGAQVGGVLPGSAAEQAGLAQGDTIVAIDGEPIGSADDLLAALSSHHPDESVDVQWVDTAGQTQSASVTLASGPPA